MAGSVVQYARVCPYMRYVRCLKWMPNCRTGGAQIIAKNIIFCPYLTQNEKNNIGADESATYNTFSHTWLEQNTIFHY